MQLQHGERLGRYEVHSLIAAGAAGDVYRARDTRLDRAVALKVLATGAGFDPDRFTRFAQEARTTALINHPNIVAVYDVGVVDGVPIVVSELLEGETLRTRLRRGRLPVPAAVGYAIQIAHGLIAAHHLGVMHCALTPENLIVGADDQLKIVDFGLARCRGVGAALTGSPEESTRPPTAGCTVGYTSPEQAGGGTVDERSDIFSLGVILYEMIAGAAPFQAETTLDTLHAILKEAPRPLPARIGLRPDLKHVVQHCLEKAPAARFQSARDVAFVLEFTLRSPRQAAPRPAPKRLLPSVLRRLWPAVC